MSYKCSSYAQQCLSGCCDRFGECPEFSGRPCHHLYTALKQVATSTAIFEIGQYYYVAVLMCIAVGAMALLYCCFWEKSKEGYQAGHPQNPKQIVVSSGKEVANPGNEVCVGMYGGSFRATNKANPDDFDHCFQPNSRGHEADQIPNPPVADVLPPVSP